MRHQAIHAAMASLLLLHACGGGGASPSGPAPGTPAPPPVPSPSPTPAPPPAPAAPVTLRTAEFEGANGYQTAGGAGIVQEGAVHRLELHPNFRTSRSAALDVRLCRDTKCFPGDLDLGPIQRYEGQQSYALPDDGSAYRYVVIWCRGVNLPFGHGRLR